MKKVLLGRECNHSRAVLRKASLWLGVGLFVTLFGWSCDNKGDDANATPTLETSESTLSSPAEGSSNLTFNVESNCDWVASSDQSWCVISPRNGSGNQTVRVSVTANEEMEMREATITVKALQGGIPVDVVVKQLGKSATVDISSETVTLDAMGTAKSLVVTSNTDWTIEKDEAFSWLKVERKDVNRADVRTNLTVSAAPNESTEAREGSFDLVWDEDTITVTVTQEAMVPSVTLSKETIEFQQAQAGEQTVDLEVAGTWTTAVEVEGEEEWLSVTPSEGVSGSFTLTINVTANNAEDARPGKIIVTSMETESKEITVTQAGLAPSITLSSDTLSVSSKERTETLTLSSNYAWTAETEADWVTIDPSNGEAGQDVSVQVAIEKNTSVDMRTATVKFSCTTGTSTAEKPLTIEQKGYDGDELSADGSANCYIVNKPGTTYKFDATVMGNGQGDEEGYIQPYKLNPVTVKELWRDNASPVVTDIRLEEGFVYFKTPETLIPGNVVIAVYGQGGTEPQWSWHIWVDNYDAEAKAFPITYPEGYIPPVDVVLMDRNIGALSDGTLGTQEDVIKSFGMNYQWGRKDPFPSANALFTPLNGAAEIKMTWDGDGIPITVTEKAYLPDLEFDEDLAKDEANSIYYAIEHPMTYILSRSQDAPYYWSWTYTTPDQIAQQRFTSYLWGQAYPDLLAVGKKTCYDPCPPGWRVPDYWAFKFATKNTVNCYLDRGATINADAVWQEDVVDNGDGTTTDKSRFLDWKYGFYFYTGGVETGPTMFMPAAGAVSHTTGTYSDWSELGVGCYYWTNAPHPTSYGGALGSRFQALAGNGNQVAEEQYGNLQGTVYPISDMWKSAGSPVRCMKDAE